mmetsp:Transcript_34147/g.60380  ORF Transcript_34147/g.60380 Transcript_34147/m.60380 type:complete len:422 (+) Transcript_34147:85-1350(+)
MEHIKIPALWILILTWCTSASRISPKVSGRSNADAGSEEGDSMMLLQGMRSVNVQPGSADDHGNGHHKEPKATVQAHVPPNIQTLAQTDDSLAGGSKGQNPTDYVTAMQIHLHRHLHLASGPSLFVILFALLIVVCFFIVMVRNVGGDQLFGIPAEPEKHSLHAEWTRENTGGAFGERTQSVPQSRKASPVPATKNVPSAAGTATMSSPLTTGQMQARVVSQEQNLGNQMAADSQASGLGYQPPAVVTIPPLCPKMSMPACEARFLIPKHAISMVADGGALKIVGLSGSALFQATVRTVKGYRLLEMSLCTDLSTPCATIRLDHPEAPSGAVIRGEGGAYYGILEMRSDGSCEVTRDDRTLMFIEADTDTLTLSLKAPRGQILATVSCLEHVDIKVSQGNDVVLLISCILAVLIQSAPPNF